MEFKGTPENWKITSQRECNSYSIGNENGTVCYTAYSPGRYGKTASLADAKLIAAAPELLNALQDAITGLEWEISEKGGAGHDKASDEKLLEWKELASIYSLPQIKIEENE